MKLTDLYLYQDCPLRLWYHYHNETMISPILRPNNFDTLIQEFLFFTSVYECNTVLTAKDLYVMNEQQAIHKAFFQWQKIELTIPFMVKENAHWILFFPFFSCYPKISFAQTIKDSIFILKQLDIPVKDVYCIRVNPNFVYRQDGLTRELFISEQTLYNEKKQSIPLSDLLQSPSSDLYYLQSIFQNMMHEPIPTKQFNECKKYPKCNYINICHKNEIPIINITNKDENLNFQSLQYAMIQAQKNNGRFYDLHAIQGWIHNLQYPISYLDFEWENYCIPPYIHMKVNDVLIFEYSLHIEYPNKKLSHYEFLEYGDCRENMILNLLHDLPKQGSIVVYDKHAGEALRLKQLAMQFPKYKSELESICNRMCDLASIFRNGSFYDISFQGKLSLKKVYATLCDNRYETLSIHDGLSAIGIWRQWQKTQQEELKQQLLNYCSLDTYACKKIIDVLKNLI